MNPSKPILLHADAMHSEAFTGNLQRASLLPGEIAVRTPISQEIRSAASTGAYPQPAGASLYRRDLDSGQLSRGVERPWWHWPTIVTLMVLAVCGFILFMSDNAVGADFP